MNVMPAANILVSSQPLASKNDLRRSLSEAGLDVVDHALGSAPAVNFDSVHVAIIEVGTRTEVAVAQTRRWRVELGDTPLPVLWVLPDANSEQTVAGFEAGADAVLAEPCETAILVAQVRALLRSRKLAARVANKASEARLLGEQLQKAYAQLDHELEMARRIHRTFLPRTFPEVGAARFAVCYRPRSRVGGDFYDVLRLDETHIGFYLGDVMTSGSAAGSLLSVFVKQAVRMKQIASKSYRLIPPDEVLVAVNRELIGLGLEDPPLVAMLVGVLNVADGTVTVARAGGPAPVRIPANGEPESWNVPGPFLGTADTSYLNVFGRLDPGDKLVLGSDGTRPDGDPVAGVASDKMAETGGRHRSLGGQAFLDALARDLLPHVRHPDDFTLLALEMGEA